MSFISQLARHRIQARQQLEQAGPVGGKKADGAGNGGVKMPDAPAVGGRPAPKKAAPGLSGAMMRQTVSDLFRAGEELGLNGPLLARHSGSLQQLTGDMKALTDAIEAAVRGKPEAEQALARSLPGRLVRAMSTGLASLDPAGSAAAITQLFKTVTKMVDGPALPSGAEVRAIERFAQAAAELGVGEMGVELRRAADLVRANRADPNALDAAAEATFKAVGGINQSGGPRDVMFRLAVEATLAAAKGKEPVAATAELAGKLGAKLNDGQLKIVSDRATEAKNLKAQADQRAAQVAQQVVQTKGQYDAQLAGANAAKLQPLEGLRGRVTAELSPPAQVLWYQQVVAHVARDPGTVSAIANAAFAILLRSGSNPPNANALNQVSAQLAALAAVPGMTAAHLDALARDHTLTPKTEELPATLKLLTTVLQKMSEGARGKLLALDGTDGVVQLADSMADRTARYARANNGPEPTLVATFEAQPDENAARHALKNAVRFAGEIPDTENGPIVQLLRQHFPADAAAVSAAKQDLSVMAAAHPTLPVDSLARFVAIAADKGADLSTWLADLELMFKASRGSKDNARELRSLIAIGAEAGSDMVAFVKALNGAKLAAPVIMRTVSGMLNEKNYAPDKAYIDDATAKLKAGAGLLTEIEERLHAKMVKDLNLDALVGGANVKVTPKGMAEVQGPLAQFFRNGAAAGATVNQDALKGFLVAVLEDRSDSFRYTTEVAEAHLACLSPKAKQAWMQPQVMMHIRFEGDGEAKFKERINDSAKLGGLLTGRMEEAWGKLGDLQTRHTELVKKLREIDKNDIKARAPLIRENRGLPGKIRALEWATKVAQMTPETTTPIRFMKLSEDIPTMSRLLGPAGEQMMHALTWTLRLSDIRYSEVVTDDGPDFPTLFKQATTACLSWPGHGGEVLGYQIDANKRFVVTKNQAGEMRRAVLRLVERQDEGHVGEPMLLLERTYPDRVTEEEKQRLVEHTIRRAVEMGINCGFATEYYWSASQTQRGRGAGLVDMNAVLEDLVKRYDTKVEQKIISLLNRASNMNCDYLDSGPPNGAAGRGQVGYRGHQGRTDKAFENEFVILSPR